MRSLQWDPCNVAKGCRRQYNGEFFKLLIFHKGLTDKWLLGCWAALFGSQHFQDPLSRSHGSVRASWVDWLFTFHEMGSGSSGAVSSPKLQVQSPGKTFLARPRKEPYSRGQPRALSWAAQLLTLHVGSSQDILLTSFILFHLKISSHRCICDFIF